MSLETFQILLIASFALLLAIPVILAARVCRRRGLPTAVAPLVVVPGVNVAMFYWLARGKTPASRRSETWPTAAAERREILRAIGLAPVGLLAFKSGVGVAAEIDTLTGDAMARIGRRHLAAHPQQIKQACILAEQMRGQDFTAWRTLTMSASRGDLDAGNTVILDGFVLPRGLLDACAGWAMVTDEARHAR